MLLQLQFCVALEPVLQLGKHTQEARSIVWLV